MLRKICSFLLGAEERLRFEGFMNGYFYAEATAHARALAPVPDS